MVFSSALYHNTSWQGSKITVAEGREHYAVRLEREKLETKLDAKNKVRANKILELNLNAPMPSTDDNLLIKAKWGKGFISVSRTPMPWSYNGQEPVARLRAYNSDSEDEIQEDKEKENQPEQENVLEPKAKPIAKKMPRNRLIS